MSQEIEFETKHSRRLINGKWYKWCGWVVDKEDADPDKKIIKNKKDGWDLYKLDDDIIYSK